jgi:hypothetical protein
MLGVIGVLLAYVLKLTVCAPRVLVATQVSFFICIISCNNFYWSRSQWPRSLRHRSAAVRLLRLWFRIPPRAWMFVYCECCVLSGRVLCDELITRPEESYRLWCVVVCDLETSWMRRPWPTGGCCAKLKKILFIEMVRRLIICTSRKCYDEIWFVC